MPTSNVILNFLFLLSTATAVDARPRPRIMFMLNHVQGVLPRSLEGAVARLTTRHEAAPATSLDHPVVLTTIFDP